MQQFASNVGGMVNNAVGGAGNALPIKLNELFKLANVGLNADLFKFGNLTLESEKYICVKDGGVSPYPN